MSEPGRGDPPRGDPGKNPGQDPEKNFVDLDETASGVLAVINRRRSVRDYAPRDLSGPDPDSGPDLGRGPSPDPIPAPVPSSTIWLLATAARLAPSASNFQPWRFVFVTDPDLIAAASAGAQAFVGRAHVIVVGVVDRQVTPTWNRFDLAIAMEHIVLVATELGYGTCHVGAFSRDAVRNVLAIPDEFAIVELVTLGTPAAGSDPGPRWRKPMAETAYLDCWGRSLE